MLTARKTARIGMKAAPTLATELADIGRTFRSLFDPYRPELHYMRGPGPKWHAKHDQVPVSGDALSVPGLLQA
jgi:hypothetical protein